MNVRSPSAPMLELNVEEVVLEVPGAPPSLDVHELVRQALELLLRRLPVPTHTQGWRLERLTVDDLSMDVLQSARGPEALADALHARVMEEWR
jgi:hypothetical protein